VTGVVEGRRVTVGAATLIREWEPAAARTLEALDHGPGLRAFVTVDGQAAGVISYADRLRPNARAVVDTLAGLGFARQILLSGDTEVNVRDVARQLGIGEAHGDLLPQDKVTFVSDLSAAGHKVLMVGDGANDAPALSTASVGIALAAHGGGISAEAADVVLLADDLGRIPEAVVIARRTMRIARQSIGVGLALSVAGMLIAAAGHIPPAVGALVQEAIDVAVILNALRVTRPGPEETALDQALSPPSPALAPS
jgi:P-type E1-E2 ATPase